MKYVILGTAGHIDHGKTALVKALTGVDTDRLKEEKERGITIELGFTYLDLPSGIRLGIIDVPGHERFVKHMVAGAWGIDIVALIIAADEGVMPQTREHLDICKILNVKKGIIVITKIDLVDNELIELVKEEVKEIVKDSFLEHAPIIPVSSITGEGIPLLLSTLDQLSLEVEEKPTSGLLRLPIDRVFIMKGFGTVVTGTLVSGNVFTGENIEILPFHKEGKVRNIQVYNQSVERAVAGQRTAINIQGIEASEITRGSVLIRPKTFIPSQLIDAYLEYLPHAIRPLKNRTTLRFHIGSSLASASIIMLDREELNPGEGGFVQLRLDRPVVVAPHDRFVIRASSLIQTVGGGIVLDPHPLKHKRFSSNVLKELKILKEGNYEDIIAQHIINAGLRGIGLEELLYRIAIPSEIITEILKKMEKKGEILWIDSEKIKVIGKDSYQRLREMILNQIKEFHQRFPMKSGLLKEELRTKLPSDVDPKLFQNLIQDLIQSKEIILEKDRLRLPQHQVSSIDEKGLIKKVEEAVLKGGLQTPSPKELAEQWGEKEDEVKYVFDYLVHQGVLIKIKDGIYIHQLPLDQLKEELISYLKEHGEINTSQFKELTQVSRKYTIPLIEYFDQIRLTLRVGEKRILRGASKGEKKE
jgi:selenocysteine-specific elongation factor